MSGFTNDLINYWGFPALGAKIPNLLDWEPIEIQNYLTFHDFGHILGHFLICDSPKAIENEGSGITSE